MIKPIFGTCLLLVTLWSCQFQSSEKIGKSDSTVSEMDSIAAQPVDTGKVLVPIIYESWKSRLAPIEENVRRIDTITKWTNFFSRELDISTEGGDATYYQNGGNTEKIVVNVYGETFQEHHEYYLVKDKLAYVLEKRYAYNRPMYYDSTAMKENKDSVTFDFSKSTITRNRFYVANDRIVYAVTPELVDTIPGGKLLTEETTRVFDLYNNLRKLSKQ